MNIYPIYMHCVGGWLAVAATCYHDYKRLEGVALWPPGVHVSVITCEDLTLTQTH